jgi:hypothetical protein
MIHGGNRKTSVGEPGRRLTERWPAGPASSGHGPDVIAVQGCRPQASNLR